MLAIAPAAAGEPNGASSSPSLSADGRYVAFASNASNLALDDDSNGVSDVFVRDRTRRLTTRVSITTAGAQANGPSFKPSISGDGRYIAFESYSSNLVAGDTNDVVDVFVHDLHTGETRRASVTATGAQIEPAFCDSTTTTGVEADSFDPPMVDPYNCGYPAGRDASISGDGRYIAFVSEQSPVTSGGSSGYPDVYVYDRATGKTVTRASVSSGVTPSRGGGDEPSVSLDGRYVAFSSHYSLVSGDTNGRQDIFVRDLSLGETSRASLSDTGGQASDHSSDPSISDDGRYVAFSSPASNMTTRDPAGNEDPDTNGVSDVFRRDRTTGSTIRVSGPCPCRGEPNGPSSNASIRDGQIVVFETASTNQVPAYEPDTNGVADIVQFTGRQWLNRLSADDGRQQANGASRAPSVSGDGTYAAFATNATTLWGLDGNGVTDIGVHTWVSTYSSASASVGRERGAPQRVKSCESRARGPRRHVHRRIHRHRTGRRHAHVRIHVHGRAKRRRGGARTALTEGYCKVSRESEENREDRRKAAAALRLRFRQRRSDNVEHVLRDCDEPIYHYTDAVAANGVYTGRNIVASGPVGSFPSGAHASKLWPEKGVNWDGQSYTQSSLSQHLWGGQKDMSAWVLLCASEDPALSENPRFRPTRRDVAGAPADYWYAPEQGGVPVPIVPEGWGDNAMDP